MPRVSDEEGEAEGEGDQRLGRVEVGVAGQLADDLDGDGGHRLERVERQPRRSAGASTTIIVSPMAREAASRMAPTMPGSAAGSDDALDGLGPGGAEASEPSRMRARHGGDDVVGERGDEGDQHDPHDQPGGQHRGRRKCRGRSAGRTSRAGSGRRSSARRGRRRWSGCRRGSRAAASPPCGSAGWRTAPGRSR